MCVSIFCGGKGYVEKRINGRSTKKKMWVKVMIERRGLFTSAAVKKHPPSYILNK